MNKGIEYVATELGNIVDGCEFVQRDQVCLIVFKLRHVGRTTNSFGGCSRIKVEGQSSAVDQGSVFQPFEEEFDDDARDAVDGQGVFCTICLSMSLDCGIKKRRDVR